MKKLQGSQCDTCGDFIADLDAGFSPAVHGMRCPCGGRWIEAASFSDGSVEEADWDDHYDDSDERIYQQ